MYAQLLRRLPTWALLALLLLVVGVSSIAYAAVTGANGGSTTVNTPLTPLGRIYDLDGVKGGTQKIVGGRAYQAVSATDTSLASAGASAHVDFAQTYSMPANTCQLGTRVKIHARVTVANASGTDTLETKLYIGATTLLTTTAVDPAATTDFQTVDFSLVCRAAPGATAAVIGDGHWLTDIGGVEARAGAILATTNLATNGALVIKVSSKWSSTTASTQSRLDDFYVEIL